ncbi:MAG: glycerate kinase [Solirubrobacteraceae bacterium]|nr:glycerate kinase [Solirubrobacteraceae bacterium]
MAWADDTRPVLVAPDAFKGTFTAPQVAAAIAEGLRAEGVPADECPIADGGEGTADLLRGALGGAVHEVRVDGPLGDEVLAAFTLLDPPAGKRRPPRTAVLDMASASGLPLVAEIERDPLRASTAGTGQLIAAAIDAGAELVLVACGGSATVDGGAGALDAIEEAGGLRGAKLTCLVDVETTWADAPAVFGPQKGASPADIAELEQRLTALAATFPSSPALTRGSGAGGGLSGGLHAALGAAIEPGAAFVLATLGVDARMRAARFVIVGEGRLDRTTLRGKAPGELATRARQGGVPCHAVVGSTTLSAFDARIIDLMEIIEAPTRQDLVAAGRYLATR